MDLGVILMISWFPVLALVVLSVYVYMDAPEYGMSARKWAAIAFFVPFFGFFAYLFERSERTPDPDREMYTEGVFEIHESRADETGIEEGGRPTKNREDAENSTDEQP